MEITATWEPLPALTVEHRGRTVLVPMTITVTCSGLPWKVDFIVDNSERRPRITSLRMEQLDGGLPIEANALRGVRLGAALEQALDRACWPVTIDEGGAIVWPATVADMTAPGIGLQLTTPRRRRSITDADMKRTAALHEQAIREGRHDRLQFLADGLKVSRATAHRWRDRATRLGYITTEAGGDK